ncbi:MAG: alpha/beta fold hydrolase [Hyphomicrobiaceae bacterium]
MIETAGQRIDYHDHGEGQPIVFVPGSYSTPSAWRGVQKALPSGYRLIGTSLCGYGQTDETRTLDDLEIHHLIRVVESTILTVGKPVHLVGHSFGATAALATALSGAVDVLSLTTFEANPLWLLREGSDASLFGDTQRMSREFEEAYNSGERDAAARIIDFWGLPGAFASMPEAVQDYCRSTTFANVLDWRTAFRFEASGSDYSKLKMPVLLVRGSLANSAMVHITDRLQACVPNNSLAVIDGAGHFLITTHAAECGILLANFLDNVCEE